MFELNPANSFKRDMKKQPIGLSVTPEWIEVMSCLMNGTKIPEKYCDHDLKGNWKGYRECHINPDLLLIYKYQDNNDILLYRIGTHSELFG